MRVVCPVCSAEFPIEAGLLEDDGKRLAAILAELEPALARAALSYLRFFKPARTALRTVRAIKLLQELLGLVRAGSVCRDERGGVHRPATAAMWVAGIEQMIAQGGSLELPLSSHVYLRKVVFGLADAADAVAEKRRHEELRTRSRSSAKSAEDAPATRSMDSELQTLKLRRDLGRLSKADYDRLVESVKQRHEAPQDAPGADKA